MAVWAQTDFTGGAIGTNITTGAEPIFSTVNGSIPYAAVPGISGAQGIQIPASTFGNAIISLGGRTQWRIGWRFTFLSSSSTTAYYFMLAAKFGGGVGTVGWDVGLRNASGNRHLASRNNFSYAGEATGNTMTAGETWSVEAVYDNGAVSVLAWEGIDTAGAPAYTWNYAYTLTTPDALMIGSSGTTNVSVILSHLWVTDGERLDPTPLPGTVDWAHNGYTRQGEFAVNVKTTDATTCAIEVDTDPGFSDPLLVEADDKGDGYWSATATGLPAGTLHYWRALADGAPSAVVGQCKTLPATGALRLGWGSCFDSNTSGVFGLIAAREPDAFIMLGDYGYAYITGGPNGNTSPTDVATVRAHREPVLLAAGPRALFAAIGYDYTYSDCDGAGANADGTTGGHATGAVQQAYRQQFAHPDLPLVNSGGRSWTWGRVRFILTDETAAASVRDSTDNSSKSKLGAEQKAWFKGQIDTAAANGEAVIWFGDGPWIEPAGAGSATYNSWAKYNTERTELGAYIATSGVPLIRLHGDTHTLFLDDGSNNPWGGFPTASAAPMHTTGQPFGYTTSGPKWPTTTTNSSRQYGICDITDTGDTLTIALAGYSSTAAAPAEVQRFAGEFVLLATPSQGTAAGTWSTTGAAVGTAPEVDAATGSASGSLGWSGSATGSTVRRGAAAGATGWAGTAQGVRTAVATANGSTTWAGVAVGRSTRRGTASGSTGWAGAATGRAPSVDSRSGTAAGDTAWAGGAVGRRHPKAAAAGAVQWAGTAHGINDRAGTAAGTTAWTGTAHGSNRTGRDIMLRVLAGPTFDRMTILGPHMEAP